MAPSASIPAGPDGDGVPRPGPGFLRSSGVAPGTANPAMPFDHLIVVMMENHSFDNLLGDLGRTRPEVDGLTFDGAGNPTNTNPGTDQTPAVVRAFALADTAQATHVTQSWAASHAQINGGAMDGFVTTAGAIEPMGYYPPEVLPFAYSLADQFTLANQWFCSLPGPTYPNRRFLLAGTAYGGTVTGIDALLDKPPPNGTICDRLSEYNINWCNYFTDIPMTMAIPSIIYKHPRHFAPLRKFFNDCQAGTLPAVSFVDPGVGVLSSFASHVEQVPLLKAALRRLGANAQGSDPAETEEDPQDMYWGEAWAAAVVQAVLDSETWERTLLIYTYDEHGGYFDHVAPPAAALPDDIPPALGPGDPPGGYDVYGPRVPAIVVSPYSTAGAVTNTVHDHTSVLATIETKWNIPALTARDGNANDVMDFLDLGRQPRTGLTVRVPPNSGPPGPVGPERTAS